MSRLSTKQLIELAAMSLFAQLVLSIMLMLRLFQNDVILPIIVLVILVICSATTIYFLRQR
jgi:hypothetical protein